MRVAFGEYQLDTETRTLQREGRRIPVQSKAFDLLAYLIERHERVVSSDELLDALWPGLHVTPAALSTAAQKARQAVGDDGDHQTVLHTEHGKGFRFVAEVTDLSTPEAAPATLTHSWTRLAFATGVAVVLLAAVVTWFLNQPAAESAPPRSVAVLPFANMSQDAAAQPFTNGIYDDILTHLSKIRDLKVIARTTMERLDPSLGIQEIGTKLGVAAVLEGGVQRAGDRIRINVQLNDCETEAHLWAETYDRELTAANIFAIQSEIATSVADALKVTLSPKEHERIAVVPTQNMAAYQAYLLGKQRQRLDTSAALVEAADYFQQAIDLDPSFAMAYVGLADTYAWQSELDFPFEEMLVKAEAAANKALSLDDGLGEAYNTLAHIKQSRMDFEGAEAAYQRALELSPNYAPAYYWYGNLLREMLGRAAEALELHRRGLALDPLSAPIIADVGQDLAAVGRYDEALAWLKSAVAVDPDYPYFYIIIGVHYWFVSGQLDEAAMSLMKAFSLDPGYSAVPAWLGWLFLDLGDPDRAESWIRRSIALGPENRWPNAMVQTLHLYLDRNDQAALDSARAVLAKFPNNAKPELVLALLRNHAIRAGRYSEARALYEEAFPGLLNDDVSKIKGNHQAGIDLALILKRSGEQERADLLLNRILTNIQSTQRLGWEGYGVRDVQIYALRGQKRKALSVLRQAIDAGWRTLWWYYLKRDPNLESLHAEPEFQAMVAEIEADMAAQLARVREVERNGELEPIPEISAATQ